MIDGVSEGVRRGLTARRTYSKPASMDCSPRKEVMDLEIVEVRSVVVLGSGVRLEVVATMIG